MYLMQFGLIAVGTIELLAWFLSSSPVSIFIQFSVTEEKNPQKKLLTVRLKPHF